MKAALTLLNDTYVYSSVPEKVLLAAILEMSVRDLLYSNSYELKKETVNWILYEWKTVSDTPCFSFRDCIEHLDLSGAQIKFLITAAREVEEAYDAWKKQKLLLNQEVKDTEVNKASVQWPSRWRRVRYVGIYKKKKDDSIG